MVLGQTFGRPVVVDLAKMPHLLVPGHDGLRQIRQYQRHDLSLLYKSTPEDVNRS